MKAIFHDVQQNTEEWESLRIGKITSSSMGLIMANYDKAFGDPAKRYALKIALERMSGVKAEYSFSNSHTERGHEQEPIARAEYEAMMFVDVQNGGFFDLGNIGASPDGIVGEKGLIEIKSVIAPVHYATLKRGSFDPAYQWQLYANLKTTEREWIDFISYCEEFVEPKRMLIHRVNANDCAEQFQMIDKRISEFESLVAEIIESIKKG